MNDGDIICTINSEDIINSRIPALPVLYDAKKAEKIIINKNNEYALLEAQIRGFNQKIGLLTNLSSTSYALLENFLEGSIEREFILNRLKSFRARQGLLIDGVKGIIIPDIQRHLYKWIPNSYKDLDKYNKSELEIYRKIVCNKRPVYMRFLYSDYDKHWLAEELERNNLCFTRYGVTYNQLKVKTDLSDEEKELLQRLNNRSTFLDNDSVMNKISYYMQLQTSINKKKVRKKYSAFDYSIYLSPDFEFTDVELRAMLDLYNLWKNYRKSSYENINDYDRETSFKNSDEFAKHINSRAFTEINTNRNIIVNMAVHICYKLFPNSNKSFLWKCFGEELCDILYENLKSKKVKIPVKDISGNISYMFSRYVFIDKEINLN